MDRVFEIFPSREDFEGAVVSSSSWAVAPAQRIC
jgi:hypothetical protein